MKCFISGFVILCVGVLCCFGADRVTWLAEELTRHDRLYWQELRPEIRDSEYDALVAEWESLTGNTWQALREQPEPALRVAHRTPMLSLSKLHSEADWRRFLTQLMRLNIDATHFRLEPKYDGVAISLVYKRGHLKYALTRADGRYGRNVTAQFLRIASVPLTLPSDPEHEVIEIRGELFADLAQFEQLNQWREQQLQDPYPLPRHLVAAFLRISEPNNLPEHCLSFVAFDLRAEGDELLFQRQSEGIRLLQSWGFQVPAPVWEEVEVDAVLEKIETFGMLRAVLDYPTDGLVLKLEDRQAQSKADSTQRAPRWAAAWKYPGEVVYSTILSIEYSVGATGRITPVAHIEPVSIEGVTVTRVSLHNKAFTQRHGLKAGGTIRLHLGGSIVPAVLVTEP